MDNYRYGFQNQEKDDEIKGVGNSVNYTYRMYDPRVGRFFAVDPLASDFPWNGSYNYSENQVIHMIEMEGCQTKKPKSENADGHQIVTTAIDNTQVQKSILMTIPKVNFLNPQPKQQAKYNYEPPIMQPKQTALTERVQIAKMNLDNWGQYVIPGGGLLNSYVRNEEIGWTDVCIEAAGIIPVGKFVAKGGKIIASTTADLVNVTIKSSVKTNTRLLKLSKEAFKGNTALSKEANALMEQYAKGNRNPGLGTKFIEGTKDVYEMRSKGGARVYFRNIGDNAIDVVGYSNKSNQQQVIDELKKVYKK
jgi:RHS repeat-associated protein